MAYQPHHRTETELLRTLNNIHLALDKILVSLLTSLNLSSAFGTINHSILLFGGNCSNYISGHVYEDFTRICQREDCQLLLLTTFRR